MPAQSRAKDNPIAAQDRELADQGIRLIELFAARRWYLRVIATGKNVEGSDPRGYVSRALAYEAYGRLIAGVLNATARTEAARRTFVNVSGGRFTYANPEKFRRELDAAIEFERIERGRLGLPMRRALPLWRG